MGPAPEAFRNLQILSHMTHWRLTMNLKRPILFGLVAVALSTSIMIESAHARGGHSTRSKAARTSRTRAKSRASAHTRTKVKAHHAAAPRSLTKRGSVRPTGTNAPRVPAPSRFQSPATSLAAFNGSARSNGFANVAGTVRPKPGGPRFDPQPVPWRGGTSPVQAAVVSGLGVVNPGVASSLQPQPLPPKVWNSGGFSSFVNGPGPHDPGGPVSLQPQPLPPKTWMSYFSQLAENLAGSVSQ
jgi:hypothetical protein